MKKMMYSIMKNCKMVDLKKKRKKELNNYLVVVVLLYGALTTWGLAAATGSAAP